MLLEREKLREQVRQLPMHTTRQLQNMTGFIRANERNQPRTTSTPLTPEQIQQIQQNPELTEWIKNNTGSYEDAIRAYTNSYEIQPLAQSLYQRARV